MNVLNALKCFFIFFVESGGGANFKNQKPQVSRMQSRKLSKHANFQTFKLKFLRKSRKSMKVDSECSEYFGFLEAIMAATGTGGTCSRESPWDEVFKLWPYRHDECSSVRNILFLKQVDQRHTYCAVVRWKLSATQYVFVMICMIDPRKQRRVKGAEVLTFALTRDERLNTFRRRRT